MKRSFFGFRKSIFAETLKRMRTPAIVIAVIALMVGIIKGSQLFGYSAPAFVVNPFGTAYFFACGLIMLIVGFHVAMNLHKKDTSELYGSVPVSRDSMWTSGFLAALVLGVGMILVTLLGILLGRLIEHDYFNIGSFGYNYLELLPALGKTILFGIACYAAAVIACSITNKAIPAIVVIIIAAAFCMDTYCALSVESRYGLSLFELILPIDDGLRTAIGRIILVVLTVAAVFLSRTAFLRIRTEDSLPVKKGAAQIIIGVMLAADILMTYINIASANGVSTENLIYGIAFSVIAYLIYSLIVCKKFTRAMKRFMFYPVAAVFCLLVYLGSILFGKAYDKIDFSVNNIDYVEVTDNLIDSMSFSVGGYGGISTSFAGETSVRKGSGREAEVRLEDNELKARVSKIMNMGMEARGYMIRLADLNNFLYGNTALPICVTLKDGTRYYTEATFVYDDILYDTRCYILDSETEYREALTDMAEFEDGHFLYMDKAFDDIYQIFIEELSALSVNDRMQLMGHTADYIDYASGVTALRIANKDNTLVRSFMLSELTPKTLERYCEISNKLLTKSEDRLAIERIVNEGKYPEYWTLSFVVYDTETHEAFSYLSASDNESYWVLSYDLFKEYFEPYLFDGEDIDSKYDEYFTQYLYTPDFEEFEKMFDFEGVDENEVFRLHDLYCVGFYSELGSMHSTDEFFAWSDLRSDNWDFYTEIARNKDESSRYKLIVTRMEVEVYEGDGPENLHNYYTISSYSGNTIQEHVWVWNLSDEQYEDIMEWQP